MPRKGVIGEHYGQCRLLAGQDGGAVALRESVRLGLVGLAYYVAMPVTYRTSTDC